MKKVNFMQDRELDALVEKTYGKPFCFQQQNGCKDRGVEYYSLPIEKPWGADKESIPDEINGKEMCVSFKAWLARDPKEWNGEPEDERYLDTFWQRNFYPETEVLLQDLYEKGLLPTGELVINIDW